MLRLTQKDEQGNWSLKAVPWESLHEGKVITKELWERLYGALWKLMEYEDTGLTPELIDSEKLQTRCLIQMVNEERSKHRWIPVEKRLPEEDDFVLVTVNGIYNHITFSDAIELGELCSDGTWFIDGYPDWNNPNVVAWMPLPEPYQEEPYWITDITTWTAWTGYGNFRISFLTLRLWIRPIFQAQSGGDSLDER